MLKFSDGKEKWFVETGLITEEQLEQALAYQTENGGTLDGALINLDLLGEEKMLASLEENFGLKSMTVEPEDIKIESVQLVPKHIAYQYGFIPIKEEQGALLIALGNPFFVPYLEELEFFLDRRLQIFLCSEKHIHELLAQFYGSEDEDIAVDQERMAQQSQYQKLWEAIFLHAIEVEATQIHMEYTKNEMHLRYMIHGTFYEMDKNKFDLESLELRAVLERLRQLTGVPETAYISSFRANIPIGDQEINCLLWVLPIVDGVYIKFKVLSKEPPVFEELTASLKPGCVEQLVKYLDQKSGLILFSGTQDSGLTQTLYSCLQHLSGDNRRVFSIESAVECSLEGVDQVQMDEGEGGTVEGILQSLLGFSVDAISVREVKEAQAARKILKAVQANVLVLAGISAQSLLGAWQGMQDFGCTPKSLAANTLAVVHQKLIRLICPRCKDIYTGEVPEYLQKDLGQIIWYMGVGCEDCGQSGYKGLKLLFEILPCHTEEVKMLEEARSPLEVWAKMKTQGYESIYDQALAMVQDRMTSLQELQRLGIVNDQYSE